MSASPKIYTAEDMAETYRRCYADTYEAITAERERCVQAATQHMCEEIDCSCKHEIAESIRDVATGERGQLLPPRDYFTGGQPKRYTRSGK